MTRDGPLHTEQIDTLAASWFSRVRSGALSTADEAALESWLDRDPAHQAAYDAVERTWNALELVRLHPRVLTMRDHLPARPPARLESYLPTRIAASVVAIVFAGGIAFGLLTTSKPTPPAPAQPGQYENHVYRTGARERAVISLPDGSEVLLSEDASLRTVADPDRRSLQLERGRAFFRVARDAAHPFVVQADGRTVTAVGTAFEVRVGKGAFAVTLVEGRVRVQTPVTPAKGPGAPAGDPATASIETTEMVAGSRLAAGPTGWSVSRDDIDESTRWTRDQLVFEAKPLAEVAAQMNLRSPRKIVILDDAVGRTLISGNFRPGDVDGFASALAAYDYASVATRADGSIEISRP